MSQPHICPSCKDKTGRWQYGLLVFPGDKQVHLCPNCETPLAPVDKGATLTPKVR